MIPILKTGVLLSMLLCIGGLVWLLKKTLSFGKKNLFAKPRGSAGKGVLAAFTTGMMPWKKESARNHLPTYITGVIYHIGIFLSMVVFLSKMVSYSIPDSLIHLLRAGLAAGLIGGLGLFIKRLALPAIKFISNPDDYASNLIVTSFLAFALLTMHSNNWLWLWYLNAIIMFVYIPLGKIRHCFFFFYTRILFGRFQGRRGIMPLKSHPK